MIRLIFVFIVLTTSTIYAQSTRINTGNKGILYTHEKVFEARVPTFGWAANYEVGEVKNYFNTSYFRFGIGELKSHKETKKSTESNNSTSQDFRRYTYGKQNFAYVLRGSYGKKHYFTEKAAKNGVALAVSYSGGITSAFMMPYYIEIGGPRDANTTSIKYTEDTKTDFLDPYKIKGKSGPLKGIGETKIVPGIHGQVGVHLDWGAFDEFLRAIEAGVMIDIFPKKLPIMVPINGIDENRPYFLNLYVSLQLGKRN